MLAITIVVRFTNCSYVVDQDDQLDALAKAIARQRDLSLNISSELELHEDLIDETDRALDQYVKAYTTQILPTSASANASPVSCSTASRLGRASRSLDTVRKKTRENSSLALIGAIIVVLTILVLVVKL